MDLSRNLYIARKSDNTLKTQVRIGYQDLTLRIRIKNPENSEENTEWENIDDLSKFGPISSFYLPRNWTTVKVQPITSLPSGRTRYLQKEEQQRAKQEQEKKIQEENKRRKANKHTMSPCSSRKETPNLPPKKKMNGQQTSLDIVLKKKEDRSHPKKYLGKSLTCFFNFRLKYSYISS